MQLSRLTNLEHLHVGAGMPVTDEVLATTLAPLQRLKCAAPFMQNMCFMSLSTKRSCNFILRANFWGVSQGGQSI